MGEHGYESVPVETIREGDKVLAPFRIRRKVERVVNMGRQYTLYLSGNHQMYLKEGSKVEKMRT